jgi:hypothetical protein
VVPEFKTDVSSGVQNGANCPSILLHVKNEASPLVAAVGADVTMPGKADTVDVAPLPSIVADGVIVVMPPRLSIVTHGCNPGEVVDARGKTPAEVLAIRSHPSRAIRPTPALVMAGIWWKAPFN